MPARYRLLDSLDQGGMGKVFLADDTQLQRTVAVKFLSHDLEQDGTARRRLHQESPGRSTFAASPADTFRPYRCVRCPAGYTGPFSAGMGSASGACCDPYVTPAVSVLPVVSVSC